MEKKGNIIGFNIRILRSFAIEERRARRPIELKKGKLYWDEVQLIQRIEGRINYPSPLCLGRVRNINCIISSDISNSDSRDADVSPFSTSDTGLGVARGRGI